MLCFVLKSKGGKMRSFNLIFAGMVFFLMVSCPETVSVDENNAPQEEPVVTEMRCTSAHYSPDGRYIAYSGEKYKGLFVKDLKTGVVRTLTDEDSAGWRFSWSPDSRGVAFRTVDYEKNKSTIFKRYLDKETNELVGEFESIVWTPVWKDTIYSVNIEKSSAITLSVKPLSILKNVPSPLRLTPFVSENRVNLIELKTGNVVNLEEGTHSPELSNDRSKLLFVHYNTIKILDLKNRKELKVGEGSSPSWTACGKVIYNYSVDDGKRVTYSEIRIFDPQNGKTEKVEVPSSRIPIFPDFSPDGRNVLYTDSVTGHIFMIKLPETKVQGRQS